MLPVVYVFLLQQFAPWPVKGRSSGRGVKMEATKAKREGVARGVTRGEGGVVTSASMPGSRGPLS